MEIEPVFEACDIDLDYEYDAAMFFDFTREESVFEALDSERWFERAQSYTHSQCAEIYTETPANSSGIQEQNVSNGNFELAAGLGFHNHVSTDKSKTKDKLIAKPKCFRSSTLMKPTASTLAKQIQPTGVAISRFQTPLLQKERTLCNISVVESQAIKRRKLDGGHVYQKVVGDAKPLADLIHKVPKREGSIGKAFCHSNLRRTVPREPVLETANRAQRNRTRGNSEQAHETSGPERLRPCPLNRKEFHFKTLERAMQHASAVSSSSHQYNNVYKDSATPIAEGKQRESGRPTATNTIKHGYGTTTHAFEALPFYKEGDIKKLCGYMISSRKGDIGVFQSSKQENKEPKDFNFHTESRTHLNPPTELFSKLSLASEYKQFNGSQLQVSHSTCTSIQGGSKENRPTLLLSENKVMTDLQKHRPVMFGGRQPGRAGREHVKKAGQPPPPSARPPSPPPPAPSLCVPSLLA